MQLLTQVTTLLIYILCCCLRCRKVSSVTACCELVRRWPTGCWSSLCFMVPPCTEYSRNVAVFMAFTTSINCYRPLACCGQVLISNQYVSLFYNLNLYEDKVETTTESSVCPLIPVSISCLMDNARKQLNFDFYYGKLNGTK